MPRKKQKRAPDHFNRGEAGPKPGPPSTLSKSKGHKQVSAKEVGSKKLPVQQNQRPIVPFLRKDRILLIGEGDFSFARSLVRQYKCRKLCATCYDSKETLFEKYPQAEQNIQDILDSAKSKSKSSEDVIESHEKSPQSQDQPHGISSARSSSPKVLFSIDARKLGAQGGGGKEIKVGFPRKERKIPAWKAPQQSQQQSKPPSGPWDVICFNFPHVGGLSTDVNRQVRANQELLVGFFKSCVPLLSAAPEPVGSDDDEWEDDGDEDEDEDASGDEGEEDALSSGKAVRTGPGQILVSLFEAEPYTLWNIKDLARHVGLQVVTSFRFPWTSYEGYSHARTLGEVEGKNGGRGGWRGEDREARMYVFEAKREAPGGKKEKKKRPRGDSSDSE